MEQESLKKDKLTINSIIPNWIKAVPQLLGINIQLAAQLCTLKDLALEKQIKAMVANLVKSGYIAEHKLPQRSLSATGKQFIRREEAFAV
jgi:hypothetical protein